MIINSSKNNQILRKVKANKKYKSINEIKEYLKSNQIKNEITRQDIKKIRAKLHKLYSSYQTKKKRKREKYLEELEKANSHEKILEITNKLLKITISTKERLTDYKYLYKQIFKITDKPKTIKDLGAGLNLLSFPLMNLPSLTYYSYDIDNQDAEFLNKYFKIMKSRGLSGKAAILDIKDFKKISLLPFGDIIFLFKVIELIDEKNKKISEELIKNLIKKTRFIVVSFATKTITRKLMNMPKRKGFEMMLKRNNLKFKTIKTNNEIFYVIR